MVRFSVFNDIMEHLIRPGEHQNQDSPYQSTYRLNRRYGVLLGLLSLMKIMVAESPGIIDYFHQIVPSPETMVLMLVSIC